MEIVLIILYLYNNRNNKPNNKFKTFDLNEPWIKKSTSLEIELHKGGVLEKMNLFIHIINSV